MTSADENAQRSGRRVRRSPIVILSVAILAIVSWLASGFYTVAPNETGVITRFGKLHAKVPSGIHYALPWPIDRVCTPRTGEVKRIEVGFRGLGKLFSEPRRSDILTGDENILKIMMVVQYKIRDPVAYLFRAEEPQWLVERTVESALNRNVAGLPVDAVLTTAKGEIQIKTIKMAQEMLNACNAGILLHGGNLQEVSPPVPVLEAFKDVASAKKDSERKIDEARENEGMIVQDATGRARELISKAQGYSAGRVCVAQGDASRFLSLLEEYRKAKDVTRTRLYVGAMERILSKTKIVIIGNQEESGSSKVTIVEQSDG